MLITAWAEWSATIAWPLIIIKDKNPYQPSLRVQTSDRSLVLGHRLILDQFVEDRAARTQQSGMISIYIPLSDKLIACLWIYPGPCLHFEGSTPKSLVPMSKLN